MIQKYSGLDQMISQNERARQYFNDLPDFVRDSIRQRASNVNSFESLQDYAENLLRADD